MFKNLLSRSWVFFSEVGDILQHYYRWRQTLSTPPSNRVLDMYALEDRVLFNIAPIMNAAALQAGLGVGGAAIQQNQPANAPLQTTQLTTVDHQEQAGQATAIAIPASGTTSNIPTSTTSKPAGAEDVRHVDFAIIDKSLQNIDQLISSLKPTTEVLMYDGQQDSAKDILGAVSDWAKMNDARIDSLSILSHGALGSFGLGNQWLSMSNLADSANAWKELGAVIAQGGNIDIFGCNVAAETSGKDLIDNIGLLSGAAVFASVDDTGFGGNWILEAASRSGNASTWQNPLNQSILQQWKYELAPGITVTPTSGLTTTEAGGTTQFTIVLDAAPTSDVRIPISSSNPAEGAVSTAMLTFTSANWNVAQTVTVSGVNDNLVDGNVVYSIVTAPAQSSDLVYNNMNAADVSVTNIDNGYNTVYVDTIGDVLDGNTTSIANLYANKGADGVISLREAILAANATVNGAGGPDRIYFNIAGGGVHTIAPTAALPDITEAVIIDGYTQTGASANTLAVGNNAVMRVELNGISTTDTSALTLAAASSGSTIRGLVINNYDVTGINILSSYNTIAGNFIGTNISGTASAANSYGVYILNGQYNVIGGTLPAARNVISGNATEGIYVNAANLNTITGNYIGTNAAGTASIANGIGIYAYLASSNTIGGTTAGAGNVISGNTNCGIHVEWCDSGLIQGNYIGTDAAGSGAIGNMTGVLAYQTTGLTIGGTTAGSGNIIANNSGLGVNIYGNTTYGVRVLGNSIYSNGGLGIDLGSNSVTINDPGDTDAGANNLQNFPVLTSATTGGSQLTVQGTFNGAANTSFRIEIFANTAGDPSGYGEGQRYLGSFNVTTDGSGNASYTQDFNGSVAVGEKISATATNLITNDTSEFAQNIAAAAPGITVTPISDLTTTEAGGQATFSVVLNSAPSADVTINLSTSDSTEGTVSTSSLTFTTANWNVAQTVTVTGINDTLVDGNIDYTVVTASASSADINYNGINPADVALTNIDNGYNTVYVDTANDVVDGDTSSIAALYGNKGTDGIISLREAMLAANSTTNGPGGLDRINFNITGAGSHTIALASALPGITDGVIIDGYSQSGAAANSLAVGENAVILIELSGASAGSGAHGLTLDSGSDGSTIRGLAINSFQQSGINILSNNNIIAGNFIGTNAAGVADLGNNIGISISARGNMVGGTTADARNIICNNTGAGVAITGDITTGVSVLGNHIYANDGLGIDLGNDGLTLNDASDADTGANNLQNYPALTSAIIRGGQFTVIGSLNGTANTTFRIGIFANNAADPSGHGEGQRYLGSFNVTTDGSGNAAINHILSISVIPGEQISATATNLTSNDTSEFAQCVTAATPGITITPLSPPSTEFMVNTTTADMQNDSAVAMNAAGNYVIAWTSANQDGSGLGIYAQRYNAAGVAQGTEFKVNTTTVNDQSSPVVAMNAAGIFVIAWTSSDQDGSGLGIYAQRYNAAGVAQGTEFKINTTTAGDQSSPAIAMNAAGNFVVAWTSANQDGSGLGIYAQRYNSTAVAQGTEFKVNTTTAGDQSSPTVAIDTAGNFIVAWTSANQDGSGQGIYAQRYNATGVAQGSEFLVNTHTAGDQSSPSAGMDAAGNFVVTWTSSNQDGGGLGVYAQRYNAAGIAQGGEFRVNTHTTGDQSSPSVAMSVAGNFVIAWTSANQDGSGLGIYAQRYNTAGVAQGSEILVNTFTAGDQGSAAVAMNTVNYFVTTWTSSNQDSSGDGIYAKNQLFTDLQTTEVGGTAQFTVALNTQPTTNVTISHSSSNIDKGMFVDPNTGDLVTTITLTFSPDNWNAAQTVTVQGIDDHYVNPTIGIYTNVYSITTSAAVSTDVDYNNIDPTDVSLFNIDNDTINIIWVDTNADNDINNLASTYNVTLDATTAIAYLYTHKGVDGKISLREAMTVTGAANAGPGGPNRIYFNLPEGQRTIMVTNNASGPNSDYRGLPVITKTVWIDGTNGISGPPQIVINGTNAGPSATGFTARVGGILINGLVINNFAKDGINSANSGLTVKDCYIGTDITGTIAMPNGLRGGSGIYSSGANATIGGPLATDRNVIAGNNGSGISINGNTNRIQGNYIGVDSTGLNKLANTGNGIWIGNGKTGTIIGGSVPGEGNIISGNLNTGIDCAGDTATIAGNYIGVNLAGAAMGNTGHGVLFEGNSIGSVIGGTVDGAGNRIAYNSLDGIRVTALKTGFNDTVIEANQIYANTGLGINLGVDGVTPNDAGDTDAGANFLQNYPVLTSATTNGSLIRVTGTLNSMINRTYRIELFANSSADPTGYGEGQVYLGYTTVTTDASGNAGFSVDLLANVLPGSAISATATDMTSGAMATSEFARNISAQSVGITVSPVSGLTITEDGTTTQFSVVLNSVATGDVTIQIHSDNLTKGTISASSLTFTAENWYLPQIITITGVDNHIVDADIVFQIITDPATGSDPLYSGVDAPDVSVTNINIDVPSVIVSPADTTLVTSENGLQASFSVVLETIPTSNVTIDLSNSNPDQGTLSTSSLTFTPDNWNIAQTVTITGLDDAMVNGNVAYTIITTPSSSLDTDYNGLDVADISVVNISNDTAGISIIPSTPLITTEAGGQASLVVVLNTQPTADVTFDLSSSDTTEGTVSVSALTFTALNWNIPQTVTVTGLVDNIVDGDAVYTINLTPAISGDAAYNGIDPSDIVLTNINKDVYNNIYVNTVGDTVDGATTSIADLYTNPGADGYISLREAILAANNTVNAPGGPDRISFNIAGSGVHAIALASALPNITDAVVIDGYTQSGASANMLLNGENAIITIELNGVSAGSGANGLTLASGSSGSTLSGLVINGFNGSAINVASDTNTIIGNFLGTNAGGTVGIGNGYGVYVTGANNIIGGTSADERNLISGNSTGVEIYGSGATGNSLVGNYIGTNAAKTAGIANNIGLLADQTINLTIGGTTANAGNIICYNTGAGVVISGNTTSGIRVLGNSISFNGGLGIDLNNNGVTLNDANDADTGPNNMQNFPVLTGAAIDGGNFMLHGSLNSTANTSFRIEVFTNSIANGSGYGEGQLYLGAFDVTTDSSGNVVFSQLFNVSVADGEKISATATNLTSNDTSEFAQSITAVTPGIIVTPILGLITDESGGQATFTVVLACAPTTNVTINISSSNTNEGVVSASTLTFTPGNWNVAQTVTITGVDESLIDGNVFYSIVTGPAVSSDLNYNGLDASDVSVVNNNTTTINTIWVDTNSDVNDGDITSLLTLFNNRGVDGRISLREAIIASMNTANCASGNNRIYFNIPDGSHTINLTSTFPSLLTAMTIDGSTDSHFAGTPIVELNGANAGGAAFWTRGSGTVIRGLVINNFTWAGVAISSSYTTVAGCYLGTDVTGTIAMPNGVGINVAGNHATIGGITALDRNVISGNTLAGINVSNWDTTITGNYIGVDATGNAALPNRDSGIIIYAGETRTTIGGTATGAGNVISGNLQSGILINGFNNTVQGNSIGTNADGTRAIGNAGNGITITSDTASSYGNLIGGDIPGAGNLIAYNTLNGVAISGAGNVGNRIWGNSVYGNSLLGIDLGPNDGVTPNDQGDADTGANNMQNYPILIGAATNGSQITIQGSLNSAAVRTFRIEFFADNTSDPTGCGEGRTYLGYVNVTTDADGNTSFLTTLSATVAEGMHISATATNLETNDTSEFARNVIAKTPAIIVSEANDLTTSEDGRVVQFTVVLNAPTTADVTIMIVSNDDGEGVINTASLIFTTANWYLPQTVSVVGVMDFLTDGNVPYTIVTMPSESDDQNYRGLRGADVSLVNIDHVNTAPALTVPTGQYAGLSLLFSTTTGNAIRIQDNDAGNSLILMKLLATDGQITLATTDGLTFVTGNGSGNTIMEFTGTASALNTALEGLRFNPSDSTSNLQISVNDQGNSGSGGAKSSLANVAITAATPQQSSLPPPMLLKVPTPSTPTTVTLPSSPQTVFNNPMFGNQYLTSSFQQGEIILRSESINRNDTVTHDISDTNLNNAKLNITTSDDLTSEYSSANDRSQAFAFQPIISKMGNDNLIIQTVLDKQLLWKDIKAMAAITDKVPLLSKIGMGTVITVGAGLSVGYAMAALRWGALLTSGLTATLPLWNWIDPLPIFESQTLAAKQHKFGGSEEGNAPTDESLETLMSNTGGRG